MRIIIAFGISVGLFFIFKNKSNIGENTFLEDCGRRSLEIYVIHNYFNVITRLICGMLGLSSPFLILLEAITSILINLFGSFSCVYIFKKLKIYDFLFKSCRKVAD